MGTMRRSQFVMETSGYCFLCLKPRTTTTTSAFDKGRNVRKVFSLHNICQYLKLNLRDVLAGTISLLPGAASALEGSELKGSLCEECGHLSETFSAHFLELEVIQMKLEFLIKSIYDKMVTIDTEEKGTLKEFKREMLKRPETLSQYGIVEQLRKKTMERCYRKLRATQPRVTVKNVSNPNPTVSSISGSIKMECCPDMDLMLNQSVHEIDHIIQSHNFPPTATHADDEVEPNSCLVECDICHLKVSDLFGHISTAHIETHVDTTLVTGRGRRQDIPSFKIPHPVVHEKTKKLINSKDQRHHCDLCGKSFAQSGTLNRHRQNVHFFKMLKRTEKINLPKVSTIMADPINLGKSKLAPGAQPVSPKRPMKRKMGQGKAIANLLPESTPTSTNSSNGSGQPLSTISPETGHHICNLCSLEFKNYSSFSLHHQSVHLKVKYECPICGQEFKLLGSYNRHHNAVHGGTKTHTCHKCSSTFKKKIGLIMHQRNGICEHEKKRKYDTVCSCHICGQEFTRLSTLQNHFRVVHLKLREHMCNLCGKSFSTKSYLAFHRCLGRKLNPTHADSNVPGAEGSASLPTAGIELGIVCLEDESDPNSIESYGNVGIAYK